MKQSKPKFKTVVEFLNDFFSYEDDKGVILGDNFAVIPKTEYERLISNDGSKQDGILFQAEIDAKIKNCKVEDLKEPTILTEQQWLRENPKALESVQRGLKSTKRRKIKGI